MNRKHIIWLMIMILTTVNQGLTAQDCTVDGGVISPSGNTVICSGDGNSDIINVNLSNNSGSNSLWLLTDQNNVILSTGTSAEFNFEGADEDVIIIYHVSHDGTVSFVEGVDLDDLTGCFDLSNPISIIVEMIDGGVIFDEFNTTVQALCVDDGVPDFVTLTLENNLGNNSRWVITDEDGFIIDLPPAPPFSFEGETPGLCTIYNITYNDITGLEEGLNILDLSGCFDLSNPYQVRKSSGDVSGGTISTGSLTSFCSGDGKEDLVTVSVNNNIGINTKNFSEDMTPSLI